MNIPESVKVWSQFAHPAIMWILFALTLRGAYSGFQSRRTRTTEDKVVRKELIKQKFRLKHHHMGAVLLTVMVFGTLSGMGITYLNHGHLFVDAHLLVGLSMTGLIALSASLVPFMEQGLNTARTIHISINILLVGLFGWEAITGMDILNRIWESL